MKLAVLCAVFAAIAPALAPTMALAQMSVTTFGATDAQRCFQAAADNFAVNTDDCDDALKGGRLTRRDRIATYANRGIILNREGRLGEALADFDRAIDENSKLAEAYLNRGNTYYLMRRYDEAIDDYRLSLRHELSQAHVAWYNIGLAQEAKKDDVKAKEAYRTAHEIDPEFAPARKKLGLAGASTQD